MYSIHLINSFLDLSHTYTILFLSRFIIIRILGRLVHITYVIHIYIIYSFGLFIYTFNPRVHSHRIVTHAWHLFIHTKLIHIQQLYSLIYHRYTYSVIIHSYPIITHAHSLIIHTKTFLSTKTVRSNVYFAIYWIYSFILSFYS